MNTPGRRPSLTPDRIRADHRRLSRLVGLLRHGLAGQQPLSHELYSDLFALLSEHFEYEEGSSLYRRIPEEYPRYAEALTRLAHEHRTLTELLDGAGRASDPKVRREKTAEFIQKFEHHEREENEILQSVFADDVGAGD